MTPGARLAAAIEILGDIEETRRPAGGALKDWGLHHRFAGSGDRAAIAGLVYDVEDGQRFAVMPIAADIVKHLLYGPLLAHGNVIRRH